MSTPENCEVHALAEHIGRTIAAQILAILAESSSREISVYLTPAEAGRLSGYSAKALEVMRSRRQGPRYFKVGSSVRYRTSDVRAWIEGGAS
ncbi:MAG: helix-turn-helix domain-containing protein [Terricaulis sp.]|nr:helix-turn-helix domain-containing protein [Terricaulis sp.]